MARSIFFYTDSAILGGAEESLLTLIETLDRTVWRPTLLVSEGPGRVPLSDRARSLEVPVLTLCPMPLGLAGARRVPALVRLLRARRPDVFHAHLSWPLAAKYGLAGAITARVPAVVATVHLIQPELRVDRSNLLQLRALSAGVGRYIAVSRHIAKELGERFRWPEHKIDVIHNGVAPERFRSDAQPELRASLTGRRARPVVLTCARLVPQKGHRVLLAAAAEVPDAVFVLAGEGPERPALEAQASSLGIADRVRFLGSRTDIPELLQACDLFVLPSLYEGTSIALLEAMAAERAIVSSAIGGTDELVDDGENGLLVPPGDHGALAATVRRLLADDQLRAALGRRARERVLSEFTLGSMADRVERVYEQLLASPSSTEA